MRREESAEQNNIIQYVLGFGASLALTLGAYLLVQIHLNSGHRTPTDQLLLIILALLAISQLAVQLYYFLHVGHEKRPRYNTLALAFAGIIVLILVFGSLWIMQNLNYHMTPQETKTYMQSQDGL